MTSMPANRQRRPQGALRNAMIEFLRVKGEPASIAEITEGVRPTIGNAPSSSYRSALQDERFFERVSRGVFRLKA